MRTARDTQFWILPGSIVAVAVAAACADQQQQRQLSQVAWLDTAMNFYSFLTHAEGAENEAQFTWLREHGCTYAQGYYFAAPMNFPDLIKWLRTVRMAKSGSSLAIRPPS